MAEEQQSAPGVDDLPSFCRAYPTLALFVVSIAGLFLELLLIRWIGTEVRIFAYLQNTVLVVCFLGLGLGCFTCRQPVAMRGLLSRLLILVGLLAIPTVREWLGGISELLSVLEDFVIWDQGEASGPLDRFLRLGLGLVLVYILMMLIWDMFVPIGRLLGRLLEDHPHTICAYSVNVAGSLVGIWLFVLLSVFYLPPFAWLLVLALLVLPFLPVTGSRADLLMLAAIVVLGVFASWQPGSLQVYWSPYQKLVLNKGKPGDRLIGEYVVTVNNAGYQAIIDLGEGSESAGWKGSGTPQGLSQYDIPPLLHRTPGSMLIVGAGTGNDAAGALRNGAKRVVAVEIDPAIVEIGRRYHPEKPYASPRVTVIQDDARSYFATSQERFDVIAFGLLDSHTTTAMTNARLDHYVYTRESIQQAKALLADGGVMVLTFEAKKPYIADRMARVLRTVFGQPPMSFKIPFTKYGWGGVMFVAGDLGEVQHALDQNPKLSELITYLRDKHPVNLTYTTPIATDNWPYIYLKQRRIPTLFYLLGGLMVLLVLHSQRRLRVRILSRAGSNSRWHFFFLGAAFLLLEVQNISKASVALGNTWWVNAVIISGILAMVLLANAIAARWKSMPLAPVYGLLLTTCVALYFVDISQFVSLPYATKALLVGGLTTVPMLFSGIVFIRSFASVEAKGDALGANLIGALVGGLLQSVTFLTGIKALLLIVGVLYLLAMLTRPRAVARA